MVSLSLVHESNNRIATALPAKLTAVFVGATSGIGKYTLKEFVAKTREPRIYFVGRAQDAADQIIKECETLNPKADLTFIKSDVSLIRNVDVVCHQITAHEDSIDLLVLSQGAFVFDKTTSEGLNMALALFEHSRFRFITNLLPQLQRAKAIKRVLSVLAGTKEGKIMEDNLAGDGLPFHQARGHAVSIYTLLLEMIAAKAPDVSFVHSYPGLVRSGIHREASGVLASVIKWVVWATAFLRAIPEEECGARHVFEATSAAFPPKDTTHAIQMVPSGSDISIGRGTNGNDGSGVYDVDEVCGPGDGAYEAILAEYRSRGVDQTLMEWMQADWKRALKS